MRKRYVIHPGDYAVGENEKLYADMAAKGWTLEKRGNYLSRFRRDEPRRLRCRVELSAPSPLDEDKRLPEEQIALYEECGWRFVTAGGLVHVFFSPEGGDAPELYTDPRQQAATLKALRRSYTLGWLTLVLVILVNVGLAAAMSGSFTGALATLGKDLRMEWVRRTALLLLYAAALLLAVYRLAYGALRTASLYRQLKRGEPLDHSPEKRRWVLRAVTAALLLCCGVFAALSAAQLAGARGYELPEAADGPYLLLGGLGLQGERVSPSYAAEGSRVERGRSLLAEMWNTSEYLATDGGYCWMYQDVYRMGSPEAAREFAALLMEDAAFTRDPAAFEPAAVEGLALAYRSGMEYIAVKGNTAYYITFLEPGSGGDGSPRTDVLAALARLGG